MYLFALALLQQKFAVQAKKPDVTIITTKDTNCCHTSNKTITGTVQIAAYCLGLQPRRAFGQRRMFSPTTTRTGCNNLKYARYYPKYST
jgi:hypothetical protein